MKHLLILITLASFTFQLYGQSNYCHENSSGSYWPLEIGSKLKYKSGNGTKTSIISGDSTQLGGKYYLIEIETDNSGKTKKTYWREENGAIFNYNEEKGYETMELPTLLEPNTKWSSSDQEWTYEVVSLSSNYSTPFCEFSDLLEIKTESSERKGIIYNLFYKKGVGLVGLNVNGSPFSYLIPNKELNEKNFMAYGCENSGTNKEIQTCTYTKVFEFIRSNFKAPKKVKKGKILVNVIIGKDGNVEQTIIVQTIPNAKKQEDEAIRVVKSLPRFIPAQIDDNQPIRASFTIPFNF